MYKSAKGRILSLSGQGMKFGLGRIKKACKLLGHPEKKILCIHVCGTVGKGSTTAMIASILKEAGFRVGEFYSPHILSYNERIQINGKPISDKDIEELYSDIAKLPVRLTFFEFTTLLALLYFVKKRCDFAVLEAGLGGRLDATRVAGGKYCVITRIDYDHTRILGESLEEIAYEKCGLIDKGAIVVTIKQRRSVMETIRKQCMKRNAKFIVSEELPDNFQLKLCGSFQRENAGLARTLGIEIGIEEESIRRGLKNAFVPARMQRLEKQVLIDSAHNPVGIKALVKELEKMKFEKLTVLFSAMKDKDYASEIKILGKKADTFISTNVPIKRGESHEKLYNEAKKYCKRLIGVKNPKMGFEIAKGILGKNDLVVVSGSMYLLSEIFGKEGVGM
ncbi:MAG: folylpolyglutamate synthase/dihydrofolate synthase family protein [Candidatus Anstonellales archaeon]